MAFPHSSLGVLLRLGHQRFSAAVDAALAEAGFGDIRPHHANVFTFVPPEGIQVSELTHLAGVRKQTMSKAVDELEALGYVARHPHPADARARLVVLTARGQSVRPIAMAAGKAVEQKWGDLLGESELEELRHSLQKLLALL